MKLQCRTTLSKIASTSNTWHRSRRLKGSSSALRPKRRSSLVASRMLESSPACARAVLARNALTASTRSNRLNNNNNNSRSKIDEARRREMKSALPASVLCSRRLLARLKSLLLLPPPLLPLLQQLLSTTVTLIAKTRCKRQSHKLRVTSSSVHSSRQRRPAQRSSSVLVSIKL